MVFITKAHIVHGNRYDYTKSHYINNKTKLTIICKLHGPFEQRPCNHLLGRGCPICARHATTKALRSTTDEFVHKAMIVHGSKYCYDNVKYINSSTKITIVCPKHGKFTQAPQHHLAKNGCPMCARHCIKPLGTQKFIKLAKKAHGNIFGYNNTNYDTAHQKITINCKEHGPFTQLPRRHLNGNVGCPRCLGSAPQNIIIKLMEQMNLTVVINDRIVISPYEIDAYVPKHKFGIELHGTYYHSYNQQETKKQILRHQHKAISAMNSSITLLQLFEHEIKDIDLIKSMITVKIGMAIRIPARKCDVLSMSASECKPFFECSHLHGHRPARHYIGLKYNNELIACLSISKHNYYDHEIIRLAFKRHTIVIGGFNKMLQYFIRNIKSKSIMTWANMRISCGNCYKKAGFKTIKISKPNYLYVKSSKIYSRQHFQKHKLKDKLKNFNQTLSEPQNMFLNGYRRLWDAGHKKLVYINHV